MATTVAALAVAFSLSIIPNPVGATNFQAITPTPTMAQNSHRYIGGQTVVRDVKVSGQWLCPPDAAGGPHYYAIASRRVSSPAYGYQAHANFMTPGRSGPDHPSFITAETWVLMSNGGWVETGIINGYPDWADNKQGPNPLVAYGFFWADSDGPCMSDAYYWIHTIYNTTPTGQNYDHGIVYAGNKRWNVYLNGQLVGVSTITGASKAIGQEVGFELGWKSPCGDGARADETAFAPYTWNTKAHAYQLWPVESSRIKAASTFHARWQYAAGKPRVFVASKDAC